MTTTDLRKFAKGLTKSSTTVTTIYTCTAEICQRLDTLIELCDKPTPAPTIIQTNDPRLARVEDIRRTLVADPNYWFVIVDALDAYQEKK